MSLILPPLPSPDPLCFEHPGSDVDEQRGEQQAPHNYKRNKEARVLQLVDTEKPDDPKQRNNRCDHKRLAPAWHLIQTPAPRRRSSANAATPPASTASQRAPHAAPQCRA